ncbi:hypothetical protein QJS04_geneDACA022480 [Acorus gramineus]|uniref:Secreted protein n=1 Tax=Acorus gramineus TaxID=55184 RepID=A0AAV9BH87_ACOGR|nr:hypothetical protein QJS04_geneDACA022480 [Acorus gramineus]
MKRTGALMASMAAAACSASSSSSLCSCSSGPSCDRAVGSSIQEARTGGDDGGGDRAMRRSNSTEQFAPRFDGLRFIETLIRIKIE